MADTEARTSLVQRKRWFLAGAIVVWTLIAWGGRVGLLMGGEDRWAWARIGGSIAIGLIAGAALVTVRSPQWRKRALVTFAGWTVLIWSRSLVVNWLGSGSVAFKSIHTVLAVGFFTLAWWAWNARRGGSARTGEDSWG